MSKQSLNLWLKSRNKTILSTILLNRISHLALERVVVKIVEFGIDIGIRKDGNKLFRS
jgi:hypothetical protein